MYMYTNHNHIPENKNEMLYRFKMAAKWPSFISRHFAILAKIWRKNKFPKRIFNEFWLIGRQHEYIYIAETKIGNFNFWVILGAKHFFFRTAKNANLC